MSSTNSGSWRSKVGKVKKETLFKNHVEFLNKLLSILKTRTTDQTLLKKVAYFCETGATVNGILWTDPAILKTVFDETFLRGLNTFIQKRIVVSALKFVSGIRDTIQQYRTYEYDGKAEYTVKLRVLGTTLNQTTAVDKVLGPCFDAMKNFPGQAIINAVKQKYLENHKDETDAIIEGLRKATISSYTDSSITTRMELMKQARAMGELIRNFGDDDIPADAKGGMSNSAYSNPIKGRAGRQKQNPAVYAQPLSDVKKKRTEPNPTYDSSQDDNYGRVRKLKDPKHVRNTGSISDAPKYDYASSNVRGGTSINNPLYNPSEYTAYDNAYDPSAVPSNRAEYDYASSNPRPMSIYGRPVSIGQVCKDEGLVDAELMGQLKEIITAPGFLELDAPLLQAETTEEVMKLLCAISAIRDEPPVSESAEQNAKLVNDYLTEQKMGMEVINNIKQLNECEDNMCIKRTLAGMDEKIASFREKRHDTVASLMGVSRADSEKLKEFQKLKALADRSATELARANVDMENLLQGHEGMLKSQREKEETIRNLSKELEECKKKHDSIVASRQSTPIRSFDNPLYACNEETRQEAEELETTIEGLKTTITDMKSQSEDQRLKLEENIRQKKELLRLLNKRIAEKNKEFEAEDTKLKVLARTASLKTNRELARAKSELDAVLMKKTKLANENKQAATRLTGKKSALDRLQASIEGKTKEKAKLESRLSDLRTGAGEDAKTRDQIKQEKVALQIELSNLREDVSDKAAQSIQLNQEVTALAADSAKLQSALNTWNGKLKTLRNTVREKEDKLKADMEQMEAKIQNATEKYDEYIQAIRDLTAERAVQQTELDSVKKNIVEYDKQFADLKDLIRERDKYAMDLKREIKEKQQDYLAQVQHTATQRLIAKQLAEENEKVYEKLEEKKKE